MNFRDPRIKTDWSRTTDRPDDVGQLGTPYILKVEYGLI